MVEEGGGLAVRAANIHLRPLEVSDEQGVFDLHNVLGVGKSLLGATVETLVIIVVRPYQALWDYLGHA